MIVVEEHNDLDCPEDDIVIWRYMDLAQLLDLLVHQQIYFPNMKILSDKYEGTIPKNIIDQKYNELTNKELSENRLKEEMAKSYQRTHPMPELSFVNCWSMEHLESFALWKIFLKDSSSGVAIKSTVGDLKKALQNGGDKQPENVYFGKVSYLKGNYSHPTFLT